MSRLYHRQSPRVTPAEAARINRRADAALLAVAALLAFAGWMGWL